MKKLFIILFIAAISATSVQAQTLDEIIEKYLENIGGKKQWEEVKSLKVEGIMSMQGMEFPFTVYSKTPNKEYVESILMGKTIVEAFDGKTLWRINPFLFGEAPQKSTDAESEEAAKGQFGNDFINYKEKGNIVVLEDKEVVEGTECFKVKIVKRGGDEDFYFFDTENYVPIMMQTIITQEGHLKGSIVETYFSDYNEVEGGLFMAFQTVTKIGGQTMQQMTIQKVEVNPDIDDSKFSMPK